jgi:hypothetical protein
MAGRWGSDGQGEGGEEREKISTIEERKHLGERHDRHVEQRPLRTAELDIARLGGHGDPLGVDGGGDGRGGGGGDDNALEQGHDGWGQAGVRRPADLCVEAAELE